MAYKNLGVSQSDYLATANKMGALFQGSGVEQQKSLELTEKAMQRATDMASVMGIDTQIALDSVAGAAKGNFTMMDNLGVAMNATNIEAYALQKGLNFKWKTASQAEKAEVAMEMFFENTEQYAGNFAREATETVSGSIGLLKASWSSFTAGLGNEKADMGTLTANVIDAFGYVFKNVKPIVKNIVNAIPKAFSKAFITIFPGTEPIIAKISKSIGGLFGSIGESGGRAIQFIKNKWAEHGPAIISFATGIKDKAVLAFNWVRDTGKAAFDKIKTSAQNLYDKAKPGLDWIAYTVFPDIKNVAQTIGDHLAMAFDKAEPIIDWIANTGFPAITDGVGKVFEGIKTVYDFFKNNWETIGPIITGIAIAWGAYGLKILLVKGYLLLTEGALLAIAAAQKIIDIVMSSSKIGLIITAIGILIGVGILLYKNWDTISAKASEIWGNITTAFAGFITSFRERFPIISAVIGQVFGGLVTIFSGIFGGVKTVFTGIIDFVTNVFTGNWGAAWEGVKTVFQGIVETFVGIFKAPINGIITLINGAIAGINAISLPDWLPGELAGLSANIPTIPMLANGGIVTKPTMAVVGEGNESEAVMPLSKLQGILDYKEGSMAGIIKQFASSGFNDSAGRGDNITFAPQIIVEGGGNVESQVRNVIPDMFAKFKEFMEIYERDKKRKGLD